MPRGVTFSVAVVIVLFAATVRLPASVCIVTNTASEKACQPGCCANKDCCATSHERTGPPSQPLAKSSSVQQNIPAIAAHYGISVQPATANKPPVFSSADVDAHSPPTLALICI